MTVEPLELPRFDGDVTHGLLPVFADRFVEAARRRMPGLQLAQEGRARVNNGVGYEVGYQRFTDDERFTGRQVLLVPDDPEEGKGAVLLSLLPAQPGRPQAHAAGAQPRLPGPQDLPLVPLRDRSRLATPRSRAPRAAPPPGPR